MTATNIPEYDVIPTGRGIRVECWYPASRCSVAFMQNMRGINYNEVIHNSGNAKTITIEPQQQCCDYQMPQGLYIVASNICRACRMHEQTSR